jgi:hypothetical protein
VMTLRSQPCAHAALQPSETLFWPTSPHQYHCPLQFRRAPLT